MLRADYTALVPLSTLGQIHRLHIAEWKDCFNWLGEDVNGSSAGLFRVTIPEFACRDKRKTRRYSVKIPDTPVWIRNGYISKTLAPLIFMFHP
jgi:hypothetical protein